MHWTVIVVGRILASMVTVPRRRNTSLQLKIVMAVTGGISVLYLVLHMIGNLKIFLGQRELDTYASFLRTVGEPALPYATLLWIIRAVLTVSIVAHIVSATVLARRAAKARPVGYAARPRTPGSYAARTMRWGGVIIALFVVYHVLDLTTGTLNPNGVSGAVHDNVVTDFAPGRWYVTLFYALAVVAVGVHLRHGIWSALATLGRSDGARQHAQQIASTAIAVVLTVGFLAVPFAVTLGLVG